MSGLARLAALRDDPTPLLELVGEVAASRARARFREQRSGGVEWSPRAVPNLAGIVSDILAGRTPHDDRFTSRPAAIDTGTLRGSIASRVVGSGADAVVEVGSRLEYAGLIQYGGESRLPVTEAVVAGARALRQRRKLEVGTLDRILTVGELVVQVPARPYVGWDDELRADAEDVVREYLAGLAQ
jgi:phage gpG-like protein